MMMRRLMILMVAVIGMFGSNAFAIYDMGQGRWLQKDPAGYVDGANLYQYVRSAPVVHNDPLGLRIAYSPQIYNSRFSEPSMIGSYYRVEMTILNRLHGIRSPNPASWIVHAELWAKSTVWLWTARENAGTLLRHYLGNSGTTFWIPANLLLDQSDRAYNGYVGLANTAMRTAEGNSSPTGTTSFGDLISGAYWDSTDWFFALGHYRMWARYRNASCSGKSCSMTFEARVEDIYDFAGELNGVQDLHYTGIAKSFWVRGSYSRKITWRKGQRYDTNLSHPPRGTDKPK